MRTPQIVFVVLLIAGWKNVAVAQTATENLVAGSDPAIQAQISAVFKSQSDVEVYREVQTLKKITDDKGEIVKQLAVFVVTTESAEEQHVLQAFAILLRRALPASIPIRVLAPYLDSENERLRDFARMWFQYHDSHDRIHGRPPLGSVNYSDYKQYVGKRLARNEKIPAGFIKFLYERHPGKALLVFAYASRYPDLAGRLQEIRTNLESARQGRAKSPDEVRQQREKKRQDELRWQQAKAELSEILLAEHVIGNAIWLNENGFAERFQRALPEVNAELTNLAKHREWWARLYVAEIMRQHPELRQANVVQRLCTDSNALVSKAAKSVKN
jgi:hypothetical protein